MKWQRQNSYNTHATQALYTSGKYIFFLLTKNLVPRIFGRDGEDD